MKKITKIAATFAVAMAMLLGAASCSHDGGASLATLGAGGGGGGGGGGSDDDDKISTWEFSDLQGVAANIKVVSAELTGTVDMAAVTAATTSSLTAFPTHSTTTEDLQKFYILEDVEYPATEGDKTMTILAKADGTNYNFHNRYYGLYTSSSINVDHTPGTLEIKGDALSIADVQGPFSVTVVSTVNGSSDKNDRYAYIKTGASLSAAIAAQPVKKADASKASGDTLTYTYDGTDKLTVIIGAGGSGSIRVFDVKVTESENADDLETPDDDEDDDDDGDDEDEDVDPIVVETKDTYTEYFDGEANIYSGATFSGIFAGGAVGPDSDGKTKTYEFASGVKWVLGTGGKIEVNTTAFNTYTAKYRLALDKTGNNGALTVPVKKAATVTFGFQNNNANGRGFTVKSTSATISNENVEHCSNDQSNGTVSVSNGKTLTYEVTGKSNNELISFEVDAADTLTIEATDGSGGGTVYIFFIDVKAKD